MMRAFGVHVVLNFIIALAGTSIDRAVDFIDDVRV